MRPFGRTSLSSDRVISATTILRLYFDGSCAPVNPGGVAIGAFRVLSEDGQVLHEEAIEECRGAGATNNVAEWAGLRNGLRWVRQLQPKTHQLRIYGDSRLVIDQLNGDRGCKKEHLRRYKAECHRLLDGLNWAAAWIPRDQNKEADRLTRQHLTTD